MKTKKDKIISSVKKLSTKDVVFSPNGIGKTLCLPVQFCSKCDDTPLDRSQMWVTLNNRLSVLDI